MFPQPRDQAKAIGVYSFVASAGASIGLLLGGVLTEAINWHWIFFVCRSGSARRLAARLIKRDEGLGCIAALTCWAGPRDRRADARRVHDRRRAITAGACSTPSLGAVAVALLGAFLAASRGSPSR